MRLRLVSFLLALASSALCANITATVEPDAKLLRVVIRIDTPSQEFRMPAWSPGDYRIVNHGKALQNVLFFRDGKAVASKRGEDPNTWKIDGGADEVRYIVPPLAPGIFTENFRVSANESFLHGPAVFGYFLGRTSEPQELSVTFVPDARIECPLPSPAPGKFIAPDYDTLVDSPVAAGTALLTRDFIESRKLHRIVAFGRSASANLDEWMDVAKRVVAATHALFGEAPYERYFFLLDFGGPGGGLEHANSARLALWPGMRARTAATFLAHEFFHTYNVKRIRAKPLGPFDYSKPAVTGTLWWLEGVTDYYAEVITVRAGLQSRDEAISSFGSAYRSLMRNPARLKVSADESSRRVWEANNSSGYGGVDYYEKGKLIGLTLDLAIRGATNGVKSLDDVMRALYTECKGKQGYAESRIRELCISVGGAALGSIYDQCVMQAAELPLAEVAKTVGLDLVNGRLVASKTLPKEKVEIGAAWLAAPKLP